MLDQTLLMQTLQDIANTGERLSNPSEENDDVLQVLLPQLKLDV